MPLVLTRKVGQTILIAPDIYVTVTRIQGNAVRLSVDAPSDVRIHRLEVWEEKTGANRFRNPKATPGDV